MQENLGCVLNGHEPHEYGVYWDAPYKVAKAICRNCGQKILYHPGVDAIWILEVKV